MPEAQKLTKPAKKAAPAEVAASGSPGRVAQDASAGAATAGWQPFSIGPVIQRKVTIGRVNDAYEAEADRVADRVVSGLPVSPASISRIAPAGRGALTQRKADSEADTPEDTGEEVTVQRMPNESPEITAAEEEAAASEEEPVQRRAATSATAAGTASMRAAAAHAIAGKGAGEPLGGGTRGTLESRIGMDLGGVRVHTDSRAHQAASALHARAFTHGRDIWLARGENSSDLGLMAHEVTHVFQQDGVVRRKPAPAAAEAAAAEEEKEPATRGKEEEITPKETAALEWEKAPEAKPAPAPDAVTPRKEAAETPPAAAPTLSPAASIKAAAAVEEKKEEAEAGGVPGKLPEAKVAEAAGAVPPAETLEPEAGPGVSAERPAAAQAGEAPPGKASAVPAASKKEKVAVAPGGAETAGEPAATRSSEIAPGGAAEAAARTEKEAVAPSPPDAEKAPAKAGAEVPPAVEAAAPPPAEAAPAAEADPRFAAVKANLEKAALREAKHSLPGKRVKAAEVATRQPEEEPRATGMGSRVREMEQTAADAPKPPEPTFAQVLEEALERLTPKDPEGLDKLAKEGAGGAPLRKEVQAGVNSAKDAAAGPTETVTEKPPQEEGREPEAPALEPESAGAKAGSIGAESVLPEKKPDAEVSMEAQKQSADAEVARTGLTDEQLAKANEPSFNEALAAKQEVKANCDAAPERFRTKEAAYLEKSSAEVRDEEAAARTGMHASRTGKLSSGNRKADELKARREAERARVAAEIRKMFEATRDKVAGKLAGLDPKVNAMFDEGHAAAFEKMKSNIQERFEAWKDDRYSGLRGKWRWVKDRFRDINELSDVKRIYEEERQSYINAMKGVFRGIAAHVDSVMAECKNDIQAGRKEIETYVKGLGPELQSYGKEAAGAISSDFDALEQSIEDKKSELADSLANRYKESREQVDKWIEEEKDRNTALLVKLARKVKAIIETIRKLKDRLAAALAKARGAIGIIIGDPIGFLGNILSAVKQGFHQFKENIVEHLKAGIMGWLFGTIADAGITLPADFSLKSIFGLVLQVLGITPQSIRAKAVKLLGARNVVIIEKVWEFISKLISEGPAGLWEHIKEYLSDLKDTILDAVKEWVIAQIVKQAVLKLVSLFNPVGAFIQACLAIYNVVMFFVERIEQIIELVETVINSVYDIATGKIAAAANWIEKAMGRTVPIIISFLARLLGLGGVAEKIKSVITRIQTKVDQAVDKAINKIVGVVKKLFGKAGKTPPPTKTEGAEGEKLNVSSSFDMSGAPHTLSVEVRNGSAAIMMGSSAKTAKKLVDKIDDALGETSDAKVRKRLEGFKKGALKLESQLSGKPDAKKKAEIEKKLDRLSYQIHQFGADNDLKDLRPAGDIPEEGLAGSYNYLQGKKGDKMTPDHEPQNALMSEISDISIPGFSGFKKPFAGTAVEKYSMGEGICLNMHHSRHLETRTYGGRGSGTRNAALKKIDEKVGKLPSDAGKERVQKAIARVVVGEMEADQKQVKKIVNDSKWKLAPETKSRVTSGMDQVETMNKDKWPEAFKTG